MVVYVGLFHSRFIWSASLADVWRLHKSELLWLSGRTQPLSETTSWRINVMENFKSLSNRNIGGKDGTVMCAHNSFWKPMHDNLCFIQIEIH